MKNVIDAQAYREWLYSLDVGDRVVRWIAGTTKGAIAMHMIVSARTETLITVVPAQSNEHLAAKAHAERAMGSDLGHMLYWTFHPQTGAEIDEDLGWDGVRLTGSVLWRPEEPKP